MTEPKQEQTNRKFRWTLVDSLDIIFWLGIVFASLPSNASDPKVILPFLIIGVLGVITKGVTIFITHPKLILVESFEYFFLAFSSGILLIIYKGNNIFLPFIYGIAMAIAVIAGVLVLRKYLGKEGVLESRTASLKRYGIGAISGWLSVFLVIIVYQIVTLQLFWNPILLVLAAISAIGFGVTGGGIGGLILGGIWKHSISPVIGGSVVAILLFLICLFTFGTGLSCPLMGGC